jgi:hypothetical protein
MHEKLSSSERQQRQYYNEIAETYDKHYLNKFALQHRYAVYGEPRRQDICAAEGSIPDTRVTVHSGDMGNTFGPNGLSTGSSRHVSSSK